MPSPPPLSPTPRRADNSEFSALLSSWGSNDERRGFPSWRSSVQRAGGHNDSEEEREVDDFLTAPDSSQKGNNTTPQIRTTSPSPRRPGAADSPAASLRSSEGRLSPLMPPPSRGQLFSETPTPTFARSGLTKPHGTMTGSRGFPQNTGSGDTHPVAAQNTGQSTSTIDRAYEGVFSALNELANPSASPASRSDTSASFHTPLSRYDTLNIPSPAPPVPSGRPVFGNLGETTLLPRARLAAVSERTEPLSSSSHGSPTPPAVDHARSSTSETMSATSIANRFPLPPSPVKGPRSAGTPQSSPKKASDLIKLFEQRSGNEPPPPQPQFRPQPQGPAQPSNRLESVQPPPSAYRPPWTAPVPDAQARGITPPAPTPPPKPSSPLSSFRNLVASWRTRSGSPSQRGIGSPGRGGDIGLSRGDRGWNVSIRRRKRHEGQVGLAERSEEAPTTASSLQESAPREQPRGPQSEGEPGRSPSIRSVKAIGMPETPRSLTGAPIRTGALYYLNVHDTTVAPNFEWVQTDARLYSEGLQLVWRTKDGSQAMVTLDTEFCEEVASTYSPNNPMAGDDLGAAAARRQGQLADNLYPFKLVYDDGTERLGCDSARERVRWVDAIWTVLERTRDNPARAASMRVNRSSIHSTSDADGSASTHHHLVPTGTPHSTGVALPLSPHPQYATDDAVIPTSGGFSAPIIQRGSRRLAANGLERSRSLRRVASEADLSESAGGDEFTALERHSTANILEVPLTAEAARSRPSSRDFTFARGIHPPPLTSPPPVYSTPLTQHDTLYGTAGDFTSPTATSYRTAMAGMDSIRGMTPSSTFQTARPLSPVSTTKPASSRGGPAYTAASHMTPFSAYQTVQDITSPTSTARPRSSHMSFGTVHTATPKAQLGSMSGTFYTPAQGFVPAVAVIGPSPGASASTAGDLSQDPRSSYATAPNLPPSPTSTHKQSVAAQGLEAQQRTRMESVYSTATAYLGSPFAYDPSAKASSVTSGSFETAPPPAVSRDSHYSTASRGPTETAPPTPVRYQLHDPAVPSYASSDLQYGTAEEKSSYLSTRPPTNRMTSADPKISAYASAISTRSSEYSTAPPPPVSRSLSFASDIQEQAETATHISEPDSDENLISDLERRSSDGSAVSRRLQRRGAVYPHSKSRTYDTADSQAFDSAMDEKAMEGLRSVQTHFGTDIPNTVYDTARNSAYTTAQTWHTTSTYMTTAPTAQTATSTSAYHSADTSRTAPIRAEPVPPAPSVSTAQSVASTQRSRRIPIPPLPSSPSLPSSVGGTSSSTSASSTAVSSSTSISAPSDNLGYDISRMLNYLHGQDQARSGVQTRMNTQLDRIERKVGQIAETMPTAADLPPPLPSKRDDSPPSSPSSVSSTSTARPATPPPLLIPEAVTEQLDDMRRLLGTVIGQNNDILEQAARRRSLEVEFPNQGPSFRRLEDLLRRALLKLGDSEFLEDHPPLKRPQKEYQPAEPRTPTDADFDREGSMYDGTGTVFSGEYGPKHPAPPNSYTSSHEARQRHRFSGVPESLLDGSLPEGEFDEDFMMQNLPPPEPPREQVYPHARPPPRQMFQRKQATPAAPTPIRQSQQQPRVENYEPGYAESYVEEQPELELSPVPEEEYVEEQQSEQEYQDQAPVPYHDEQQYEQDPSVYEEDEQPRGPTRHLPPPQPVDYPTPVRTPMQYPPQPGPSMRPPYPVGGMPPPPPGMTDIPRPSLPRIAGVRDPISTTYFRRGFPPAGPMGMPPMGMFPGPMGIPGPGMGPFMPGLRPGLGGFGGPIGPNVAPTLRRPGFFPPGVPATSGDYGLPAAARYGNNFGPSRPGMAPTTTTPDTGLGNTTSESTTPSATTEELVTPTTGHTPIAPPRIASTETQVHDSPHVTHEETHTHEETPAHEEIPTGPPMETDESLRRALGNAQALAEAHGEHANEMSRYLHGMSDQIMDGRNATQKDLANILADISRLREQLQPKRVHGHVLPDGTVQLSNGDIVDGIRGAPTPGVPVPPPPPPTVPHVHGKVLPDGTVMAGDMIVDGIRGAPAAVPLEEEPPVSPQQLKDMEQDRKLASLMDKVSELMQRTKPRSSNGLPAPETVLDETEELSVRAISATPRRPNTDVTREKTVIKEREVIREGPSGRHKEHETEDIVERDMITQAPPGSVVPPGTVAATAPAGTVPATVPAVTAVGNLPPGTIVGNSVPGTLAPGTVVNDSVPDTHVPGTIGGTAAPGTMLGDPAGTVSGGSGGAGSGGGSVAGTRINPRTGKPLSLPKPLSLSPRDMSPIQPEVVQSDLGPQMIREEHEEVIHNAPGMPPIHTRTTTRTYTRPDGSHVTIPGDEGSAVLGDPAGAGSHAPGVSVLGDPAGRPHTVMGASAGRAPTVYGDPAGAPTLVHPTGSLGSHHSDHQSIFQGPTHNIPSQHSEHEDLFSDLTAPPVNKHQSSVAHTAGGRPATIPAGSVADPGSATPSKQVWDTNHPRDRPSKASKAGSVTGNPAGASKAGSVVGDPAGGTGADPINPATVHNEPTNEPATLPNVPTDQPIPDADPANPVHEVPAAPSSKSSKGVHWDPRMPHKEVAGPTPKVSVLGNVPPDAKKPESAADPSGASGDPATGGMPAHSTTPVPVPTAKDAPASGSASHPTPDSAYHDHTGDSAPGAVAGGIAPTNTEHKVDEKTKPGILQKLKPSQSKESLKSTSQGPPVVTGGATAGPTAALTPDDKNTRFSDTVGVGHSAGDAATPAVVAPDGSAHTVPPGSTSSSKLRRKQPPTPAQITEEDAPDAHVPESSVRDAVTVPPGAQAPSSTGKLKKGKTSVTEGDASGPGSIAGVLGGAPFLPAPSQLEELILPDGTVAYVKKRSPEEIKAAEAARAAESEKAKAAESAKLSKKEKTSVAGSVSPESVTTAHDAPRGPLLAESALGHGHCSVCCPSAPKTVAGEPVKACSHQDGPTDAASHKTSSKLKKPVHTPPPAEESAVSDATPGEAMADVGPAGSTASSKLKKKGGTVMSPEEEKMEDARKLAAKQKAAAEQAAAEAAEKERIQKEKADKAKLAEDRHKENAAALAELKKALDTFANDHKTWRTSSDEKVKAQEKRRTDKAARDKKYQEALDKLVTDVEENKKKAAAEGKKPGTQAILDALKTFGDGQGAFLRKLVGEIVDQLANQHKTTRDEMKKSAREQVGFNLSGYLDDFSKALSGEVRTMLKEVGDLREIRRALYYELAELLLMKGRQSHGDLMAVIPYPAAAPKNPAANQNQKKEVAKPAAPGPGGGGGPPKAPGGVPYWSAFQPPAAPVIGGPARPLPVPGQQMAMIPGAVPPPPPASATRPLPQV